MICDTDKIAIQIWRDWAKDQFKAITVIVDDNPPEDILLTNDSQRALVFDTLKLYWLSEVIKSRHVDYGYEIP